MELEGVNASNARQREDKYPMFSLICGLEDNKIRVGKASMLKKIMSLDYRNEKAKKGRNDWEWSGAEEAAK